MIQVMIKVYGEKVADGLDKDKPTLAECSLVLYRLEQIKQELLSLEFDETRIDRE